MITRNTTFILGAGASHPYGYPIGQVLIDNIIKSIQEDEIYILVDNKNTFPSSEIFDALKFKILDDIKQVYSKNYYELLTNFNQLTYFPWKGENFVCRYTQRNEPVYYVHVNNEMHGRFYKVKLSYFQCFVNFLHCLRQHNPRSIDSFLRDNPRFSEIGKLMIAYELLKCENKNLFLKKDNIIKLDKVNNQDDWYSCLLQDIKGGFTSPKDILKNRVNFVTFNYDMSLEHYFLSRLKDNEFLKEIADKYLSQLKITHVHGQLYPAERWQDYGIQLDDKGITLDSAQKNTKILMYATQVHEGIKLIGERSENREIRNQIKNSSNLIIIGFRFDLDNLGILGFQKNHKNLTNHLISKRIAYLDYGGMMDNLYDELLSLKEKCQFSLIRSTRTSITDAYNYDLKLVSILSSKVLNV